MVVQLPPALPLPLAVGAFFCKIRVFTNTGKQKSIYHFGIATHGDIMGKYSYYPPLPPSRKTVVMGWLRDILIAASIAVPAAWGIVVYLAGG